MLSKIIQTPSAYFCHGILSAQLMSLWNVLTDDFLFLPWPLLWLNLLSNQILCDFIYNIFGSVERGMNGRVEDGVDSLKPADDESV